MKKVFVEILLLLVMTSMSGGAVVKNVTVTASSYYYGYEAHSQITMDGQPRNVVNGSGFCEEWGYHYNDGIRSPGTMWIATMNPLPSITFNLQTPLTLSEIKVWNGNHFGNVVICGTNQTKFNRLRMGVQHMQILAVDADGNTLADLGTYTLDKAPGLADIDFGQIIDVPDTANVQYIKFNILSNYGDTDNWVALSEVRFYDDVVVPEVSAGPDQRVWLSSGSVVVNLDGTVSETGMIATQWTASGSGVVISNPASVDTAATITTAGTYTFTLSANDGVSTVTDSLKVRVLPQGSAGLVSYWKLNESTGETVYDSVVNGCNGVFHGQWTPTWMPSGGVFGGAIKFSGPYPTTNPPTHGHIWIPNRDIDPSSAVSYYYDAMASEMTVSFWFKTDSLPDSLPIPYGKIGLVDRGIWKLHILADRVYFNINTNSRFGNNPWVQGVGVTKVTDNQWHFAALTYDGFSAKLYVDARLEAEAFTYEGTELFKGAGTGVYIGGIPVGETVGYSLIGLIDDVKAYSIALGQDDIAAAYKNASMKPCMEFLDGDTNGDCQVDLADIEKLIQNWLY